MRTIGVEGVGWILGSCHAGTIYISMSIGVINQAANANLLVRVDGQVALRTPDRWCTDGGFLFAAGPST